MADTLLAVAVFIGIPLAIFIAVHWKHDERERAQRGQHPPQGDPSPPSKDSYWGGLGRPGR